MSPPDLGGCLAALDAAADAAEALGLDAGAARETAARARRRLGFPGTAFVLALAGGTGSGKSSLLNALAGQEVSRAGPLRPVTGEPVAWVPADQADELGPLLAWIGTGRVVPHHDHRFAELCLLDLPDYDSVERTHRARVDEVLPKVDAVCWVLDPEKYNDRVLHQDYLRPLAHHADRALFVVNRRDTIGSEAAVGELLADLRRTLAADGIGGRPVFAVSAAPPDGRDAGELERLRAWLAGRMQAKAIVVERLAADCLAAGSALGRAAGLDAGAAGRPLTDPRARETARARAASGARAAVDTGGVRAACVRRVRAEARAAGAGPVGRLLGFVATRRGRGADPDRSVDPLAYARAWRRRATLARTVNPVRELVRQAAAAAPAALRPAVMRQAGPDHLEERLGAAIDDALAPGGTPDDRFPPRSWVWPVIGVLQAVALGAVAFGLLWLGTLWLAGQARADLPDLPAPWGIPAPAVLIGGGLAAGLVLGRLLALSAARTGRRWADRLTGHLDRGVTAEIERALDEPLARVEAARSELLARLGDLRAAAGGGR